VQQVANHVRSRFGKPGLPGAATEVEEPEKLTDSKDYPLSTVSHELRTSIEYEDGNSDAANCFTTKTAGAPFQVLQTECTGEVELTTSIRLEAMSYSRRPSALRTATQDYQTV